MFFLGLITRCRDEFFIKEFCQYYLSQGIDKIFILDDDSLDKSIYNDISNNPKIEIKYEKKVMFGNYGKQMLKVNQLYKQIKHNFKWIISIDVDEFITTKKNLNKTIRQELIDTFENYDCIKIPWVMMSCNGIEKSPKSILNENIYRWNHDLKHPHPNNINKFRCRYKKNEVKCIFKTSSFNYIDIHNPKQPIIENPKVINSINLKEIKLNPFYKDLREKDIKNGFLLCYHYRIISIENCKKKLQNNCSYIKHKYTLEDLMMSDHPEVIDKTLYNKVKNLNLI